MNKFGKKSLENLNDIDSRLRVLAYEVLPMQDTTILYGRRTPEEQQKLFDEGKSKTLNSKHLTGKAIDMAPYPIDWDDISRFYYFAGLVVATANSLDIPIRWGGNWNMNEILDDQTFMDLVHFEIYE